MVQFFASHGNSCKTTKRRIFTVPVYDKNTIGLNDRRDDIPWHFIGFLKLIKFSC